MSDLLALMNQTLTIETPLTFSGSGEVVTWSTPVTYKCQLSGKRRATIDAQGQTVISGMTALIEMSIPVDILSRVTLTTGDVGSTEPHLRQPALQSVHRYSDEGWELVELLLAGGRAVRSA